MELESFSYPRYCDIGDITHFLLVVQFFLFFFVRVRNRKCEALNRESESENIFGRYRLRFCLRNEIDGQFKDKQEPRM